MIEKKPAGKFTNYERIQMEKRDPAVCRRLCPVCKTMFEMKNRAARFCDTCVGTAAAIKKIRLEEIKKRAR